MMARIAGVKLVVLSASLIFLAVAPGFSQTPFYQGKLSFAAARPGVSVRCARGRGRTI
jgi:hypothetical protein